MNCAESDDARFDWLLGDYDRDALLASDQTIYGMWPDLTLAYRNRGWSRFAEQNGGEARIKAGWSLGRCVLDAIAEPLWQFFATNYERCLLEKRPWEHTYECSSAKQFRTFHMLTLPVGNAEGLLVINSLRQETPHIWDRCEPLVELYRSEQGIVTQCCHCRRVRRCKTEHTWDWVPDWVTTPPADTSHGLCEPCIGFHYSPQRDPGTETVKSFQTTSFKGSKPEFRC